MIRLCPHCGGDLPPGAYYKELNTAPGRLPAYVVRHKRGDGTTCIGYGGPTKEEAYEIIARDYAEQLAELRAALAPTVEDNLRRGR